MHGVLSAFAYRSPGVRSMDYPCVGYVDHPCPLNVHSPVPTCWLQAEHDHQHEHKHEHNMGVDGDCSACAQEVGGLALIDWPTLIVC